MTERDVLPQQMQLGQCDQYAGDGHNPDMVLYAFAKHLRVNRQLRLILPDAEAGKKRFTRRQ